MCRPLLWAPGRQQRGRPGTKQIRPGSSDSWIRTMAEPGLGAARRPQAHPGPSLLPLSPPTPAAVIAAMWEVIPSPRTWPCHFNFSVSARWGRRAKVNFTLDFLLQWQFQTCQRHLDPPRRLPLWEVWGGCPFPAGAPPWGLSPRPREGLRRPLRPWGAGPGARGDPTWALCRGRGPRCRTCPGPCGLSLLAS